MNRKLIRYVASLLHNSGIRVLDEETTRITRLKTGLVLSAAFYYSLAAVLTSTYALQNRLDFYKLVDPIPYAAVVSMTLCSFFSIFCHSKLVGDSLAQLDRNVYTYPDEDRIRVTYEKYLREDNIILVMRIIQGFYFTGIIVRSFPTFVYFFVSGSTETLLYPASMPWPNNHQKWLCFTLFFQLGQAVCGIWCNNLIAVSILVHLFEFLRQFRRLQAAVVSLNSRTELMRKRTKNTIGMNEMLRANIGHCIKHHQKLYQNFQLFKVWMEIILSGYVFICTLSLAFGLYTVANVSVFLKVYSCFEIIGIIVMNLFAMCVVSEIFSNLNEGLKCALFWQVEWYKMSQSNRKLLSIFHLMCCRPFDLSACSVFRVNRYIFSKMMRATYSVFNVLNVSVMK